MLVVILGAGGHGQVTADILFQMWKSGKDLEILGFLDTNAELIGTRVMGIRVLGTESMLSELGHDAIIAAIGDNVHRRKLYETLSVSEGFVTAIHPSAVIAPNVVIGDGSMVCAGAVLNPGATIGVNTIINTGATVDHHCEIGPHSHIAPGVNLGGAVRVGQGAFVGIGASVVPGVTIGEEAVVGAGALVLRDVPAGETWVGVPATKLS